MIGNKQPVAIEKNPHIQLLQHRDISAACFFEEPAKQVGKKLIATGATPKVEKIIRTSLPSDPKWHFYPLVQGHLTLAKRSPIELSSKFWFQHPKLVGWFRAPNSDKWFNDCNR